jgi:hypothetical protein
VLFDLAKHSAFSLAKHQPNPPSQGRGNSIIASRVIDANVLNSCQFSGVGG